MTQNEYELELFKIIYPVIQDYQKAMQWANGLAIKYFKAHLETR